MDQNEMIVMALAAGVSGFYALMVFLSSRRRGRKDGAAATAIRPVVVRSAPAPGRAEPSTAQDLGNPPPVSRSSSDRGDKAAVPPS